MRALDLDGDRVERGAQRALPARLRLPVQPRAELTAARARARPSRSGPRSAGSARASAAPNRAGARPFGALLLADPLASFVRGLPDEPPDPRTRDHRQPDDHGRHRERGGYRTGRAAGSTRGTPTRRARSRGRRPGYGRAGGLYSSRIQLGTWASHFARVASSPRVQITAEPKTRRAPPARRPRRRARARSPGAQPGSTPVSTSAIATAWRVPASAGWRVVRIGPAGDEGGRHVEQEPDPTGEGEDHEREPDDHRVDLETLADPHGDARQDTVGGAPAEHPAHGGTRHPRDDIGDIPEVLQAPTSARNGLSS